jgi:hypothetical protein
MALRYPRICDANGVEFTKVLFFLGGAYATEVSAYEHRNRHVIGSLARRLWRAAPD